MVLLAIGAVTSVSAENNDSLRQWWPENYLPKESKFFVSNEIHIKAPPAVVWNLLIRALDWEKWYEGAENVQFPNHPGDTVLRDSMWFTWKTMGLHFTSYVRAYQPEKFLAWESVKSSIQGYHIWRIEPTAEGCKVITQESQNGWMTFFEKTFQGKKLHRIHDIWLTEMKKKAEQKIQ